MSPTMQAPDTDLDRVIAAALAEFERWLLESGWHGKENDCVNLFAHGFLFKRIRPGGAIQDFTQVGIEVFVPQLKTRNSKVAVRKDLVVWDKPSGVTWSDAWQPTRPPCAIIEWKARRKARRAPLLDENDLDWLRRYSLRYPGFVGYAVTVDFTGSSSRIASARIRSGEIAEEFHRQLKTESGLESQS